MQPSEYPLLAEVAAMPILLACAACDVEVRLDRERDQQRIEIASFFAVHNGHSGPQRYSVTIPITRAEAVPTEGSPLVWASHRRVIDGLRRRLPTRGHWYFV